MHTYIISYDAFEGCGDTEVTANTRKQVADECRYILELLGGGTADVFNSTGETWLFCVEL